MLDDIGRLRENEFQRFCGALLSIDDPTFQAVDGAGGDMGNDGFSVAGTTVYQAYAPSKPSAQKLRSKIDDTVAKLVELRSREFRDLQVLVFLTPFDLTHEMHMYLRGRVRDACIRAESWGATKLTALLNTHPSIRASFPDLLIPDIIAEIRALSVPEASEACSADVQQRRVVGPVSLTNQEHTPQGADYRDIEMKGVLKRLECTVTTRAPYVRFGFKLLSSEGKLFGDGAIRSQDQNLILHVSRNPWSSRKSKSGELYFTCYVNGQKLGVDKPLFPSAPDLKMAVVLEFDELGLATFLVDERKCLELMVPREIRGRVAMLAWADDEDFTLEVHELVVTSSA